MSPGRIDFHAHILPAADHGSDDLAMSLRQVERALAVGVSVIVATPHFYPHRQQVASFLRRRERSARQLLPAVQDLPLEIRLGAEVFFSEGVQNLPELGELCIAGTDVVLLEMPDPPWGEKHYEAIYEIIRIRGLRPVMAHVDRYPVKLVQELLRLGVMAQLNAEGICSRWRRRQCRQWVREGRIYALGSDVHGDGKEYQDYARALKLLGAEAEGIMGRSRELIGV